MRIALVLLSVYALAVTYLVTRVDRPKKNRQRLAGRGGDFES